MRARARARALSLSLNRLAKTLPRPCVSGMIINVRIAVSSRLWRLRVSWINADVFTDGARGVEGGGAEREGERASERAAAGRKGKTKRQGALESDKGKCVNPHCLSLAAGQIGLGRQLFRHPVPGRARVREKKKEQQQRSGGAGRGGAGRARAIGGRSGRPSALLTLKECVRARAYPSAGGQVTMSALSKGARRHWGIGGWRRPERAAREREMGARARRVERGGAVSIRGDRGARAVHCGARGSRRVEY